jgi:hypothetical protein
MQESAQGTMGLGLRHAVEVNTGVDRRVAPGKFLLFLS